MRSPPQPDWYWKVLVASRLVGSDVRICIDFGRITGKPHLTACFSDWSRNDASDSGIWQSRSLRIECQDWIAAGGGLIVLQECRQWQHNVHSVAAFHCNQPFWGKFNLWRIVVSENPYGGKYDQAGAITRRVRRGGIIAAWFAPRCSSSWRLSRGSHLIASRKTPQRVQFEVATIG